MNYSIHGILKIASNVKLPIPTYFQMDEDIAEPDIEIYQRNLDFKKPEGDEMKRVSYYFWQEGPKLFFDFAGTGAKLTIDNLIGHPIVEFNSRFKRFSSDVTLEFLLLRILFLHLIQKGHTFVHAGCICYPPDDSGSLITTLSDFGKTSTVLSLVSKGAHFLSDDHTILSEDGWAYSYPRPVTVSIHTRTGGIVLPPKLWKRILGGTNLTNALALKFLGSMTVIREISTRFIQDKKRINKVFMLGGYDKKENIEQAPLKKATNMMLLPILYMSGFPDSYADLYCYLYGIDMHCYLDRARKIVRQGLQHSDCFELRGQSLEVYPKLIMGALS